MSEYLPPNQAIIQADIAQRQAAAEPAPEPEPTYTADDLDPANDPAYGWDEPAPESGLSPEFEELLYERGLDPFEFTSEVDEAIAERLLAPEFQAGRLTAQREADYALQEQEAAAQAQQAHQTAFQSALQGQPDLRRVDFTPDQAAGYLDNALNVLEEDLRARGYDEQQIGQAVQENPQAFYEAAAKLVNDAIVERANIDWGLKRV